MSVAMLMNMLQDHQKHLHGNYDQRGIPNPTAFTHAINPIDKIAQNTPLFWSHRIIWMTFMLSLWS